MKKSILNRGSITIEINSLNPEKILNILWKRDIDIIEAKKTSITTIFLTISYENYKEVYKIVENCKGKIKIIKKTGIIFFLERVQKEVTLILGGILFFIVLYILSTYIWGIEIETEENLAPYEVRKELALIGIKPGVAKKYIDVDAIEKKLSSNDDNILWLRVRIEGSILKVIVKEKITPPKIKTDEILGSCIASRAGEVKRIFIEAGSANVTVGDIVNEGDILINGTQGKEGVEFETPAKGTVIANTFYEKEMEVQISGKKLVRGKGKLKDIYLNFFGKKIYLKKAINKFKYYDKIESSKGIINTIIYFERKEEEINIDKEVAIEKAAERLEESLTKELTNDGKIIDRKIEAEEIDGERIRVKVNFVVEQNIAKESTE